MKTNEFNYWVTKFKDAIRCLNEQDQISAKDLIANVKINYMRRTIKYVGQNKDLAGCFLPPSCFEKV